LFGRYSNSASFIDSLFSKYKSKKNLITNTKTSQTKIAVRYNKGNQQDVFLEIKAFQGSGILYVLDQKIYFTDTLNKNS